MSPAGEDTIAAVRSYLTEQVLPGLSQGQRSEFRAALKLLDEAAAELAGRSALRELELRELIPLCEQADTVLGRPASGGGSSDREDLLGAVEERVLALQEQVRAGGEGRDLLRSLYACLRHHALQRTPWQSVFPVPTEGVLR